MSDLARLRIWDDQAIRGALSWYLDGRREPPPSQVPYCRDGRHCREPTATPAVFKLLTHAREQLSV
jgi:hypothetical protein